VKEVSIHLYRFIATSEVQIYLRDVGKAEGPHTAYKIQGKLSLFYLLGICTNLKIDRCRHVMRSQVCDALGTVALLKNIWSNQRIVDVLCQSQLADSVASSL